MSLQAFHIGLPSIEGASASRHPTNCGLHLPRPPLQVPGDNEFRKSTLVTRLTYMLSDVRSNSGVVVSGMDVCMSIRSAQPHAMHHAPVCASPNATYRPGSATILPCR